MLILPIKKKWFDMILSGEKLEEYREIKPYYETRFMNLFGYTTCNGQYMKRTDIGLSKYSEEKWELIRFRNGYRESSPSFIAKCTLSVSTGKEEWGAKPGKEYFVLTVKEILNVSGMLKMEAIIH